jgi:hypothetical protein
MMRPGGKARAVALALDDAPRREEPHQKRALPPRQNEIGRWVRRQEILIADDPLRKMLTQ